MQELRREFLTEAISNLKNLQIKLQNETLSEETNREIFRALHTLKGTSQTFDLNVLGKLAHEIENLLQAKKENRISQNESFARLLTEGIALLLETFRQAKNQKEIIFPVQYVEKLRSSIPDYTPATSKNLLGFVPPRFLSQLSADEKNNLNAAFAEGKQFYLLEAGFNFADFAERFKELRQVLSRLGEVVANFPSPKFAAENKIGFQIFLVSLNGGDKIIEAIQPFGAKLIFQNEEIKSVASDLQGILAQAVLTGEKTALMLGKTVEIEISREEFKISQTRLKLISAVLLHLIRNAVDHAIEAEGKIKIEISNQENDLLLRVADNGRGIDMKKIRDKAITKNLISAEENLTKEETLKLIFAHGFSTSEEVTEISGRGVGLDVVEDAVKQAGGAICVESEKDKGTTFEIRLPKEL